MMYVVNSKIGIEWMAVKIQSLERVNVKGFDLELVEYCLEMILEKSK